MTAQLLIYESVVHLSDRLIDLSSLDQRPRLIQPSLREEMRIALFGRDRDQPIRLLGERPDWCGEGFAPISSSTWVE